MVVEYKVADGSICNIRRNLWQFRCEECGICYTSPYYKKARVFAEKHVAETGHQRFKLDKRNVEIWVFICPYCTRYISNEGYTTLLKYAKQHLIAEHEKEISKIADKIIIRMSKNIEKIGLTTPCPEER